MPIGPFAMTHRCFSVLDDQYNASQRAACLGFQRKCTLSFAVAFVTLILAFPAIPGSAMGQGGNDEVITMNSGLQFEGEVFTTQKISHSVFAFEPFEAELVVVIDDGLRRVFVSKNRVINLGESQRSREITFEFDQRTVNAKEGYGGFVTAGPFDEYGHRTLTISVVSGGTIVNRTYVQGITEITPRYCILKTLVGEKRTPAEWTMRISTKSVPKSVLRNMMHNKITNPDSPNEFFDIAFFFQQAKDYDQASEELRQIEGRFPGQKERIRDARDQLNQYKARQRLDEVKQRIDVGQVELGLLFAKVINKEGLAGEILAEFQSLLDDQQKSEQDRDAVHQRVRDVIAKLRTTDPEQAEAITEFQNELETQLTASNMDRLAAFNISVLDKSTPEHSSISQAISGWILGSNNAEPNLAVSQSLFKTRKLVREYITNGTSKLRRSEILNILANVESATPKNVDAILKQMKPIDPPAELANYTGEKPIEIVVEIPGTLAQPETRKYSCLVHVPHQYDPYRKYPLILSLPDGRQPLEANLDMWAGQYLPTLKTRSGHAMRNGYIVAAIDYRTPNGQTNWGYSTREHLIVLKALKKCLRSFSVDTDRVFISGHGVGANGAYDIGSAHPEHWAGVIGYSGAFDKYVNIYQENRHLNLPFYCVNGSKHHTAIGQSEAAQNKWVRSKRYNDVVAVHYQGRANEFFVEDIPHAFEWMRAQRRRWPDRLGFEFEVTSLRPTDSYYWFFEMLSLPEERMTRPVSFGKQELHKMTISGKVENNIFRLAPEGYADHDSILWLSPEFVDFQEVIQIKGRKSFKGRVEPSIEVILNDYRRRADPEHLFWGRIDFTDKNWNLQAR